MKNNDKEVVHLLIDVKGLEAISIKDIIKYIGIKQLDKFFKLEELDNLLSLLEEDDRLIQTMINLKNNCPDMCRKETEEDYKY